MDDVIAELEYALAKQVPDMERGFTIETRYGSIEISNLQAPAIIAVVRTAIEQELAELR